MIVKIERQDAINKYPSLPLRQWNAKEQDDDYHFPAAYASYILTIPSKSYRGHIKLLGTELTSLIKHLNLDKLIFLGDISIPWLKRDSDLKPAKEALQYLADNKRTKRFNKALQIGVMQLPALPG